MSRKAVLALMGGLVAAALVVILAVALWPSAETDTPDSGGHSGAEHPSTNDDPDGLDDAPVPVGPGYAWPRGQAWTYRFDYELDQRIHIGNAENEAQAKLQSIRGESELDLDIEIRSYGLDRGLYDLGFRIVQVRKVDLKMAGKPLIESLDVVTTATDGHEARVSMAPDGEIVTVSFAAETPSLFRNLVQMTLAEVQTRLAPDAVTDAWLVPEATWHGQAPTEYVLADRTDSSSRITRRRTRYDSLRTVTPGTSLARTDVDYAGESRLEGGALERVTGAENITAVDQRGQVAYGAKAAFRFERTSSHRFDPRSRPALAGWDEQTVGELSRDDKGDEEHIRQRIGDMTEEKLLGHLEQFGALGRVPDHRRFLWQATGLIRQDPALAAKVGKMVENPAVLFKGRELVLDLLVGAGTPAAQEALRGAVDYLKTTDTEGLGMLFQRLGLVNEPTHRTVEYLEEHFDDDDPRLRYAAAGSLGAVANKYLHRGQTSEASELGDQLAGALKTEESAQGREFLLRAIGNAALPEHEEVIAEWTTDANPHVQRAAVHALRKFDTETSRQALLDVVDASPSLAVQQQTFEALRQNSLTPENIEALKSAVDAQKVDAFAYRSLVNTLAPQFGVDPHVEDIFRTILDRDLGDKSVRSRLRGMLGF